MKYLTSRFVLALILNSSILISYGQETKDSVATKDSASIYSKHIDQENNNLERFYNDDTKEVGTTPSYSGVSPTGAAVYTIPLAVPKGHSDFAPSISLTYNSQTGNNIAGYGVGLSGISLITRGIKDIFHDGKAQPIKYQANDAYYLDGKRLILASGTPGTDGAVYAPEGEALTHVTLHNNAGDIWFEINTTDGMRYEYGKTSASRQVITLNGSTATNAWYVGKAENPIGLVLTYTYMTDDHYLYPLCISYGNGNTVSFEYGDRYDAVPFAIGTTKGSMRKLLLRIISKYNNTVYRKYQLVYINDRVARLKSIQEVDENDKSLHPIQFQWNTISDLYPQCNSISAPLAVTDNCGFVSGDINGDGKSDIIQLYNDLNNNYTYAYVNCSTNTEAYSSPRICRFSKVFQTSSAVSIHELFPLVNDYDGDGTDDILFPFFARYENTSFCKMEYVFGKDVVSSSEIVLSQQMPLSFLSVPPLYCAADFNNDGKCDIFCLNKTSSNNYYIGQLLDCIGTTFSSNTIALSIPSNPKRLFAADYNHDGLSDIMVIYDTGCKIFWNNSGILSNTTFSDLSCTSNTTITNTELIEIGDFNGDGIPDFVTNSLNNPNWFFMFGNPDGTFSTQLAAQLPVYWQDNDLYNHHARCLVFDIDRDGKSDVVIHKVQEDSGQSLKTRTYWMRSTGSALSEYKTASSNILLDGELFRILLGDFRGIGYPELMNYGNDCYNGVNAVGTPQLRLYQMGYADNGKLNTVRGSMGNMTYFTYASLADTDIYTKGSGCSYPLRDVSIPLCVTTKHRELGRSKSFWDYYEYSGLKAQVQGRGLIGFEQVTVSHNTYTTITTTMSGWENNSFLVPTHSLKISTCDGYTSSEESTLSLKAFDYNYILYPSTLTETDINNHVKTTTYSYNQDLGYLQQQRTTYDGNSMYCQIDNSDFVYKGRSYRPQTIIKSQKHVDDTNCYSQTTKLTYNNYGLPSTLTELFGTDKWLTHTYSYDTYGNILSDALSGSDIAITHYYEYDSMGKRMTKSYTSPSAITMQYEYDVYGNLQYENDATNPSAVKTIKKHKYNGLGYLTSYGSLNDYSPAIKRGWGNNAYEKSYTLERYQGYPWRKTWYDTNGRASKIETVGPKGVPIEKTVHCNGDGQPTYKYYREGYIGTAEYLTYDHLNRLQSQQFSTGKTVSYTYGDRSVTKTENGRSYTTTYDAWGNVKSSTDPVSSVSYTYYSNGKPKNIISEGSTVTMGYDAAGNQTSLSDPDAGMVTYEYDALGRLKKQTDARAMETSYSYDAANRVTQKTIDGTPTIYTYGTSGASTNCLTSIQTGDRSIVYTYNNRKVASETRTMSGMSPLTFYYEYNNDDLVYITYPNGFWAQNNYDGFGNIQAVNLDDGTNVWYLDSINGENDYIKIGGELEWADDPYADDPEMQNDPIYSFYAQEYFNVPDAVMTLSNNRDNKGFLSSSTLRQGNNVVSQFGYTHDYITGNLLTRTGMLSQQESFAYDNLDRLTDVTVGNTTQLTVEYDDNGNIASKTGLGTYYYNNNIRPHAVTGVQNASGLPSSAPQQITYNALGKVASIAEGDYTLEIIYGPDEQRWKSVLKRNGTVVRTTIYANNYERVMEGNRTLHFCYMDGSAVNIAEDNDDGTTYYIVTDNLGSVTKLVDIEGNVDFEACYDAWGKQTLSSGNNVNFHRGYTGHEMLPEFGLINMNGRLYDPILGRFLSPDNYVQMPDFSQSFNRYSYCLNNPLKYTDPSGELFGIDDALLIYSLFTGAFMGAANASMNGDNIWTGALKGLASSALSTIGTAGIGQLLGHTLGSLGNELLRASLHGVNNGLVNIINGKNFGTGFITGAMASFAGSGAQALGMNSLGVIASTTGIGGITSSCMGGSFYDGAMTGLNIGILNHEGKVIRHKDGTLEAVDPLPEFVVRSRHSITLNMAYEKPLETINPEFYLLVGWRSIFNSISQGIQKTESFFYNSKYTEKVKVQMKYNDYHGFPPSVEAFEKDGIIKKFLGGDGKNRLMLEIRGNYKGKDGVFEFIKEQNGEINHRYFRPY